MHRDMAILSMVGKQMRNMVGIAARMFTTLAQGNVNIEMISQGANEINISCVLDARDAIKALNLIHQSCLQIKPEGPKGRGSYTPSEIIDHILTRTWLAPSWALVVLNGHRSCAEENGTFARVARA
jgi:ACT domain